MTAPIKVGIVGVGRGQTFARGAGPHLGLQLVALCDTWEERLNTLGADLGVATYTDFDRFLEHDLDAVVLANYFHQHAPFAIKALHAGMHVMSETSACFTLAQGVALIEAVEATGKTYLFAENYPYFRCNQEMRRLYLAGEIGQFRYAEGEYVHPFSAERRNRLAPGVDHWRNWLPATYYSTHALAPIMHITGAWPVAVNGFVIPCDFEDPQVQRSARRSDTASMIAVRMATVDSGDGGNSGDGRNRGGNRDSVATAKLLQGNLRGEGNWVRIHGNRGLMENVRAATAEDRQQLRIHKEPFDTQDGQPYDHTYLPDFPVFAAEATQAGHGGGDFFTSYHFARAIRGEEPPFWDVYRGVAASIVGIQAYRSALQGSNTVEIPDFRQKDARDRYRHDHWSPDPTTRTAQDPWPSVLGNLSPSAEGLAYAQEVWSAMGYVPHRP